MQCKRIKSFLYILSIISIVIFAPSVMADDTTNGSEINTESQVELSDGLSGTQQKVFDNNTNQDEKVIENIETKSHKNNDEESEESSIVINENSISNNSTLDEIHSNSEVIEENFDNSDNQTTKEQNEDSYKRDSVFRASNQPPKINEMTDVTIGAKGLRIQYQPQIPVNTVIKFAVWSDNKGQDDLVWYTARDGGVSYVDFSNHRSYGLYHIHTYSNTNGVIKGLNVSTITIDFPKVDAVIESVNDRQYKINVSNVSQQLTEIIIPVWSNHNGQDDLKWYKASKLSPSTYSLVVDLADHQFITGHYSVHLYGYSQVTKSMIGLKTTDGFVFQPKTLYNAKIKIENYDKYKPTFDVVIDSSESIKNVNQVRIAVWSANKGQDDLKWYKTTKLSDTKYQVIVPIKNHNFDLGHYNVHIYAKSQLEQNRLIGIADAKGFNTGVISLSNPIVAIKNHKPNQASLDVLITTPENSYDVTIIKVAAWSEKKQENIHWYVLKPTSSKKVTISVNGKFHHNVVGDYTVHTYLTLSNGKVIGYDLGKHYFEKGTNPSKARVNYFGTGVHQLKVDNLYSDGDVVYAVWSEKNGQDDLKWYKASKENLQAQGMFNVVNHTNAGTYHIHVYQKQNGKMYFVTTTTKTVKHTNYNNMPHYLQWDSRWSGRNYGSQTFGVTGCVPTALSMVYTALSGKDIKPTNVGDYLYHHTNEFNRKFAGTSALGILQANKAYGFKSTVLSSQKQLEDNLKVGHYVLAAVQNNKFVSNGSHEIVLKGYQNGMTYVTDPWSRQNTGWYPVTRLFAERSHAPEDVQGVGVPFIKITD
ncbi:GBS Bsp-like repeat-containing protein [Streptococcus marimammalium]|uniref:GBS Bsp-like repeat-containing protein n=1 Tax=Streptococcus marimammalium TaxID=269666 RepID=UPI0003730845|nr:GBS Bsp-like repeat-containing protein [Streptococcus marimammalium]